MIVLSPTQSNKVVVTLKEKSTLLSPFYTWEIENQNSFDKIYICPDNFTLSPYYDAFTISVGTPSTFTSSVTIDLVPGEYHYKVYETTNQYDLGLTSSVKEVEVGLLFVSGTFSLNDIISFTESNDDVIRVFNEL